MSEHTPLTEAETNWLGWVVYEGAPSRDDMLGKLEAVARRIKADAYAAGLAARTSTATAGTGLRERVEALRDSGAIRLPYLDGENAATVRGWVSALDEVLDLLDATPASTEDRTDNEGTR